MNDELDNIETVLTNLHRTMFQFRAWERLQRDSGITLDRASATLLKAVSRCDKPCRLHDIAQLLAIEAPSASRTVQQLEQAGLLERTADKSDRRASNLMPTAAGLALLHKLRQARRKRLAAALADWSAADRQQLATLIQNFGNSIENTTEG